MSQAPAKSVVAEKAANQVLQVNELVARLRAIDPARFTPEVVGDALRGLTMEDASLAPYIRWRPKCYTRNLVYRDAVFELLVVCWESGSSSAIHNHAGQECLLYIHQGALGIDGFDLVDPACAGRTGDDVWLRRRERLARLGQGVVDHRGPSNDIHRVANRRTFGARAISLHVYSRPIDVCVVYDRAHGQAEHRKLRYDSVAGADAAGPASGAPGAS